MKTIKINKCEGYIWWSNQERPKVYQDESIEIPFDEHINPFVVEGLLFDRVEMKSYSIKFVDGQYMIKLFDVKGEMLDGKPTNPNNEIISYLFNDTGEKKLKFLRFWEEEKDKNCMGMPVLTLTKNVFIGFK